MEKQVFIKIVTYFGNYDMTYRAETSKTKNKYTFIIA